MSKFNTPVMAPVNKTVNKAGGIAYKNTPEMELLGAVVSGFLSDGYYEKGNDRIDRIKNLVTDLAKNNPVFLLGLVEKVRKEYHMRSTSHVLIAEATKVLNGEKYKMSDFVADAIERVDDITEILAYLVPDGKVNKKAKSGVLSHSLLKGLKKAFGKFDEYQLAKYDREATVNLKDVVRLTHASGVLAEKVLTDALATPETWEVKVSAVSKTDKDYAVKIFSVWKDLMDNKMLGYMAALRNLRNIVTAAEGIRSTNKKGADELVDSVTAYISNENAVKNSKQLPFRYLAAYREIQKETGSVYSKQLLKAIESAAEVSIQNLDIKGDTAVFADVSGSMQKAISDKSSLQMIDIGLLFSGMVGKMGSRGVSGVFWDTAKIKTSGNGVFDVVNSYREGEVGYATNGYLAIELLTKQKLNVDNIMLFTDEEMYGETLGYGSNKKSAIENALTDYRNKINPDVNVYIFNLSGNGTKVTNHGNVFTIHGWSEKIFEYIKILDTFDNNTLTQEIEANGQKYVR